MQEVNKKKYDICVVGGAGHIGLPLSILLAKSGLNTLIYDINPKNFDQILEGQMPFFEAGAEPLLREVLSQGMLGVTTKIEDLKEVPSFIVTIGTPVDEFLNPVTSGFKKCIDTLLPVLSNGKLLILRSTISPGITEWLDRYLKNQNKHVEIAFCPERVVQGHAIQEIQVLPQIVSAMSATAQERAIEIFSRLTKGIVPMKPMEAELAKLFSNVYRYIQFGVANQFYMLATVAGLDYSQIYEGMCKDYSRMRDLPKPGFAAGPCLFKDTMQLAAFSNNNFSLGYDAMRVNEGLPLFLIDQMIGKVDLQSKTVGLLGMAFKANSDDIRASLSYKFKKSLVLHAKKVLTADPWVKDDPELIPVQQVIDESDILILCVPHSDFKQLDFKNKPVVDIWNFLGRGNAIPPLH